MINCIFTGHCIEESLCNTSCPILAQTSYLLERNGIKLSNPVFKMTKPELQHYADLLNQAKGQVASVVVPAGQFTNRAADALTYCAICEHWKGSQLHCTVYNLKFAQYIESMQKSWSFNSDSSEVDYMKIWASSAQVLVVSNLDFVNFKDFQCQTILSLLQSRDSADLTTIVVTPPPSSLVGDGQFFSTLTRMLAKQKVGESV